MQLLDYELVKILPAIYQTLLLSIKWYLILHSTKINIIFDLSNQFKTSKTKKMKKLITTISTSFLIFMIPALFVAYLYNSTITEGIQPQVGKSKTEQVNHQETSFKPGVSFLLRG